MYGAGYTSLPTMSVMTRNTKSKWSQGMLGVAYQNCCSFCAGENMDKRVSLSFLMVAPRVDLWM